VEIWRKIPGLPDEYEASSIGRIRRLGGHYDTTFRGKPMRRKKPPRIYALRKLSAKGYARINLRKRVQFAHRLIAMAWVPNPDNLPQVNHRNGDKLDNRPENLEWVSNQANRDHAVATGLQPIGSRISKRLTEADIPHIRARAAAGESQGVIAEDFGVCQQTISHIVRRSTWQHVQG
jgi:hypothetical protein